MAKPRLLDLFCGAGGAGMGYHLAGFEVIGVDIAPQPNYPFTFVQDDALEFLKWSHLGKADLGWGFAAIHASPPCQSFTAYRRKGYGVGNGYPDLIADVRRLLDGTKFPYVIENVHGAPLREPRLLCGSMFDLDVRRHRLFEANWPLAAPRCDHAAQVAKGKRYPGATNRHGRFTCEVGVWRIPLETQKRAMGVDWNVTVAELSEALPPAYTKFIGEQLIAALAAKRKAS